MSKTYSTVYENMYFPKYVFQEYPKVVRRSLGMNDKGKEVWEEHLVYNQREELNFLVDAPPEVKTERDELALMVAAQQQQIEELKALLSKVESTGQPAPSAPAPVVVPYVEVSKVPLPKADVGLKAAR